MPSPNEVGRVRGFADFVGDSDWEDDVDDLLRDVAATAGHEGFEACRPHEGLDLRSSLDHLETG